ncbi:beta-glucuronidase [Dysgonomonas sp. Marseille-P4677]|uniref:glycoside hydrolase family 2 protein n=1 Tax=Dysgonomonas sp. Marseille-P4677 TaxID=2364790 RepID=UPI001912EBD1|nr:sugar-binding domain-containing protein [Dysgonomonas sp. Marseille-P4677]MBK5722638.1 beta-glucuronidase [Dysgonomonas sp. Marseille-P4677]
MRKVSYLTVLMLLHICITTHSAIIPRSEYPRPQFERKEWINLNGEWTYIFDMAEIGIAKNYNKSQGFDNKITVPFPPESKLSGVAYTDFIPAIWYHRIIGIPFDWTQRNIILNFGAIYYESEIYIDGKFIARHFGGSDSFSIDITGFVQNGKDHDLVIRAKSDIRGGKQAAGKQSLQLNSYGCNYTRTTGIWQTVWMEAVDREGIQNISIISDIDQKQLILTPTFYSINRDNIMCIIIKEGEKVIIKKEVKLNQGIPICIPIKNMKLWSPDSPFLYDIECTVFDSEGNVKDEISSYAGMRKVHIEGNKIYLNNQPYYQRLILDQGFYPDGIWTAPNDEALKNDIQLSIQAGFNGARLHQKIFEERFHYWADKLGYLTWGEAPSWGMDANNIETARNFFSEWSNIVVRDRNHPSIILWTPMNEEWWPDMVQYPRFCEDLYNITHNLDPTRPVNTSSGGVHVKTDIWTVHNYQQEGQKLKQELFDGTRFQQTPIDPIKPYTGNIGFNPPKSYTTYDYPLYTGGIPYLIDEFGGIKCVTKQPEEDSWGYGDIAKTEDEFYLRLESQVNAILSLKEHVWGFCYTQLTDVEQEQNGIYYYDRRSKFDMRRIHAIFSKQLP